MKPLLIVWHSRTGARQMAEAAADARRPPPSWRPRPVSRSRSSAPPTPAWDDLLASGGFLFCAPENLASLSGEMKEFFDRCYYGALDRIQGLPMPAPSAPAAMARRGAADRTHLHRLAPARGGAGPDREPGRADAGADRRPKTVPAADLERCAELGGLLAGLMLLGG